MLFGVATQVCSLAIFSQVSGHGNMFYPPPWHDVGSASLDDPDFGPNSDTNVLSNLKRGYRGIGYPQPETMCRGRQPKCSAARIKGGPNDWFTNYTFISGEPTLPWNMYDTWSSNKKVAEIKRKGYPWTSPGSAPTYGEGCGANGGNPHGCQDSRHSSVDLRPYGSCCAQEVDNCGGYNFGKSAMDHAAEGLFDGAAVTTWNRGSTAEVVWAIQAHHMGGYSYRLCKVPAGGISKVTEQCFRDGHLSFSGDDTWIWEKKKRDSRRNKRMKWRRQKAIRTRNGTTPSGSQWAKVDLPSPPTPLNGKRLVAFRDYVQVPASLEPGHYILSFRWDAQNSPQVWNSCANINIV